jgi:streptogramin lyase
MKQKIYLFVALFYSLIGFAQNFTTADGINYIVSSTTAPLTARVGSNTSYSGVANIPATVTNGTNTYSVTSISLAAFRGCAGLTSVSIPNSVTSISNDAFANCTSLTSVTLPNSLTSLSAYTFANCTSLTSVALPNSLTNIRSFVFQGCTSLTSVTVGWSTPLDIDANIFDGINLPNATLYVPSGTIATYEAAAVWTDFGTILEANAAPTDISLSANAINENVAANSTVGTLSSTDPDAGNTFTYTLVTGAGDTDNASFNINGSDLRITNSPDFETKSSYAIRLRTTDQGSLFFEKEFTLTINDDLCETPILAPTGLAIQVYAGTSTIAALTATGTTIKWYDAATAGNLLATTTALVDGTTYYATQTTGCGESTARLAVTVRTISEATQTLCSNATVGNLVSTPSTGTTAKWFTTASGGNALDNATTLTAGTYYVEQGAPATVTPIASGFNSLRDVTFQSNGKILGASSGNNSIIRMDVNGVVSDTYPTGIPFSPFSVAVQNDGKILFASQNSIYRMNADGTGIGSFGTGFVDTRDIALESNGNILVVDNGSIRRLDSNGTNINTINVGGNPNDVAVQNDGKILIAEQFNNIIKRMDANGNNVEILGSGFNQTRGIAIQNDGKIIVTTVNSVKRMDADGTNIETLVTGFTGQDILIEGNGNILVASLDDIKRIIIATSSNRVAVTVTLNAAPTAPTVTTPVTYNLNDTATQLTATTAGTGLAWYTNATGGTALTSAPTPTTTTGGTTSYWVASTAANGCESARVEIVVIVNQPANYLHFDGVNDYVALPTSAVNIPTGNSTYTIEAMINPSVIGAKGIVGWGNYGNVNEVNAFRLTNDGLVNYWWGQDYSVQFPFTLGTWYHVAATFDGTSRKIYVNGNLITTGAFLNNPGSGTHNVTNISNVTIGKTYNDEYFNGGIDDVRIWNIARSATEINDKKACELDGNEIGLVAYYKFNQGTSGANNTTLITATSTTGNNVGTLTGFGLTAGSSNWLAGSTIVSGNTCTTLGNENFEVGNNLKMYPNPAQNIVNIEVQNLDNTSVEVYDINGRQLFTQKLNNTTNTVNIEKFAVGVYMFKVSSSQGTATSKVVKQ